jgi:hypothetical protein
VRSATSLVVLARGEELEGANPDVAAGHAGEHGAGERGLAIDHLPRADRGERAGGGDAEGGHRLAHHVFTQHGAEGRAAVAAARERGAAGALPLEVVPAAVAADDLAEEDGATVAELGDEPPNWWPA